MAGFIALAVLAVCVTLAAMANALGDDWADPNEDQTP